MTRHGREAQMDEMGSDPREVGADSGGQSGDTQGLSRSSDDSEESVIELAESGQGYEAEKLEGMEEAADHPEEPVRIREDQNPH